MLEKLRKAWVFAGTRLIGLVRFIRLHAISVSSWLGRYIWRWDSVLWTVAAFWTFGCLVGGVEASSAMPSAVSIRYAETFLWGGILFLAARILREAWITKELNHIAPRIAASLLIAFAMIIACCGVYLYLDSRILVLALSEDDLRIKSSVPPPLVTDQPLAHVKMIAQPRNPHFELESPGFKKSQDSAWPYGIGTVAINNSNFSAYDIRVITALVDEKTKTILRMPDASAGAEVNPRARVSFNLRVNFPLEASPQFVVLRLVYQRTSGGNENITQDFYLKWAGVKSGTPDLSFAYAPIEEAEQLRKMMPEILKAKAPY